MKKTILLLLVLSVFLISGCGENKKKTYLPEARNDKVYSVIKGEKEKQKNTGLHMGDNYAVMIPPESYEYEKDYDGGNIEEKWEHRKYDDVEFEITTYKNSDEISARNRFLKDNNEYIFEDLTGGEICGTDYDGDVLWFNVFSSGKNVMIISLKYPENIGEEIKNELWKIYGSFTVMQ